MDSRLTDDGPKTQVGGAEKGWRAALDLVCERRGAKTCLTRNLHEGPLVVQKALYPEGENLCHAVLIHPPGGIAGGDQLTIEVSLGEESEALFTTPGATKYYRSAKDPAVQTVNLVLSNRAKIEWLPQETIVFRGALARQRMTVELGERATYLGQDIVCLGRRASGETMHEGSFSQRSSIRRRGKLLWRDGFDFDARTGVLEACAGLGGFSVYATMALADERASPVWLTAVRAILSETGGRSAATLLPGVLIVRHLGDSAEQARLVFLKAWEVLRPLAFDRPARLPRIWNT